jgi:cell division transport system ATP-binding protein
VIEFQHVFLDFDGPRPVLQDVNLAIRAGEMVFLVGPTGSGKTSLLRLLLRQLRPTKGRVFVAGKDVGLIPESRVFRLRRQIGIVPQDILLLPNKKVWENLAYAMRAAGHSLREVREKVPEMLDRFGLLPRAGALPHQLSGGEQQRVAIARALINNPSLLLADEPTGHLDPDTSAEILNVLQEINSRGTTVLMATHDIYSVSKRTGRFVLLQNGQVAADAPAWPARVAMEIGDAR